MARRNYSTARRAAPANARTRKIRAVLAACRRLALDEDARKDLQLELTGTASMADMSEAQLGQLLDHLNRDYRGTNPDRAHIAKVKALWWSLYWLGVVEEPGDSALSAFVKRQTGISALRFLDHRSAPAVIEALKSWLTREGVKWKSDAEIADSPAIWAKLECAEWDRWSIVDRLSQLLCSNDLVTDALNYAAAALRFENHFTTWTPRQLDDVIRVLGKKWRGERP